MTKIRGIGLIDQFTIFAQEKYVKVLREKCSGLTLGTVCSGGGGVETAALRMGILPKWSVEMNTQTEGKRKLSNICSDFNDLNNGGLIIREKIQNIHIPALPEVNILWGSLPCDRASKMSNIVGMKESWVDNVLAASFVNVVRHCKPRAVCMENVVGWKDFEGSKLIICKLKDLGYKVYVSELDFEDFGLPQRRRRLIIRAVKKGLIKVIQPNCYKTSWFEAIWNEIKNLDVGSPKEKVQKFARENNLPKEEFYLIENTIGQNKSLFARKDSLLWTLRAVSGVDHRGNPRNNSIALWNPKKQNYYFLNSNAIGLLSGFPKDYLMPKESGYAAYIGGLCVPPVIGQKLLGSLVIE